MLAVFDGRAPFKFQIAAVVLKLLQIHMWKVHAL